MKCLIILFHCFSSMLRLRLFIALSKCVLSCLDKILKGIILFRRIHLLHHHTVVVRCREARCVIKVKVALTHRMRYKAQALNTCFYMQGKEKYHRV